MTTKGFRIYGTAALCALAIGMAGCRSSHDRTTGQAIDDTMTAHKVNSALSSDPVLKFPDVKVNVYNGNAQLTGFVDSEEQRNKAAQIAANVQGVSQVINEITIKQPTPTGRATIHDPLRGDDRYVAPQVQPQPQPQPGPR